MTSAPEPGVPVNEDAAPQTPQLAGSQYQLSDQLVNAVVECLENTMRSVGFANTAVPLFAFIRMNANAATSNAAAREAITRIVNIVNRLAALYPVLVMELELLSRAEPLATTQPDQQQ